MNNLTRLISTLQVLQEVYEELPLRQILTFLEVADNEGVTMPELQERTNSPQAAVSRNVKKLSVYLENDPANPGQKIRQGWDLLVTRPDLYNRKALAVYLSPRGQEVLAEINARMNRK